MGTAQVNAVDADGATPLAAAARRGDIETARFLASRGGRVGTGDDALTAPLLAAARRGDAPLVRELLEAGASADAADADQRTPLHVASAEGHVDVLDVCSPRGSRLRRIRGAAAAATRRVRGDGVAAPPRL